MEVARRHSLYARVAAFIAPEAFSRVDALALACCLRDGGAVVLSDASAPSLTHVVTPPVPSDSPYVRMGHTARCVAVVRPEWVFRTFALQRWLPEATFSAVETRFFASLAIAAPSIEKDPKKVIDGLITHFGGQVVEHTGDDALVRAATHVLTTDAVEVEVEREQEEEQRSEGMAKMDAVEVVLAAWQQWLQDRPASVEFALNEDATAHLMQRAGLQTRHCVSFQWLEECVRHKKRVDEAKFQHEPRKARGDKTRGDTEGVEEDDKGMAAQMQVGDARLQAHARIYESKRGGMAAGSELMLARRVPSARIEALQQELEGSIVLLAQHIPSDLKEMLNDVLKSAKAKVANVPLGDAYREVVRKVVANASLVVCRCRAGFEYEDAKQQKRKIASVYGVLAFLGTNVDDDPLNKVLASPLPSPDGIPGMTNLVITLSGFTGKTNPTRECVQMAIQATGACVLPVLSRSHSTHLLCFEAQGEKYKKAQSWKFPNILSVEWVLACLTQWEYVAEDDYQMDNNNNKKSRKEATSEKSPAPTKSAATATASTPSGRGRFDVDDMLSELDRKTPTLDKKQGGKADSTSTPSCKLFDTPSQSAESKASRDSNGIPSDFEFRFGRKKQEDVEMEAATVESNEPNATNEDAEPDKEADTKLNKTSSEDTCSTVASVADATKSLDLSSRTTEISINEDEEMEVKKARKRGRASTTQQSKKDAVATTSTKKARKTSSIKSKAAPTGDIPDKSSSSKQSSGLHRVFQLTGTREEISVNEAIVISLGGQVSATGRNYDPDCTHVMCSELKRTEKFVAGCAAGKWILKPSFLEASSAAGHFVDEAAHEWGEADTALMDTRIWPQTPAFWRQHHADGKPGAFVGWRFLIHPKTVSPASMCERIVLAAGGSAFMLTPKLKLDSVSQPSSDEHTVVALISADLPSRDAWFKKLRAQQLQCVNATFLIDYLTKDQHERPSLGAYCL